jgi:enoyl-[acyl-carrier-protein] reductase (NADH)
MPETRTIQQAFDGMARTLGVPKDALAKGFIDKPLLKRMPTLAETANVVAYLASDQASSITGAIINSSCGEILD